MSNDSNHSIASIKKELEAFYGATIGTPLITKVRAQLLGRTKANEVKQFGQLPAAIEALRAADPAGRFELEVKDGVFERWARATLPLQKVAEIWARIFVSPGASKFLFENSRPIFGVDGTHTKNLHKQTLLLATILDTENTIKVLAFAFVSIENEDNWSWFLRHLGQHIPALHQPNVVLMSDRDKGLIPAVTAEFPQMAHSFCCVHLAANVSSRQGGGKKGSGKKFGGWLKP